MAEQLSTFLTKEFKATPHLIGRGVLPAQGKLILGGEPKTNKSWIAMNAVFDLVRGRPIFGAQYKNGKAVLPVTKPFRVLYMEQEMGEEGLRDRLKGTEGRPGLASGMDWNGLDFFIKTRDTAMRLDTPDGRDFIYAELKQTKPDLVWMDPFSKFNLSDENSAQEMGAVLRVVDHMIEDFGCAVAINHHTTKPYKDDTRTGGNRLRGSSAIYGDIDTYIGVERKSNEHHPEPVLQLDFTLRRGEPIERLFVQRLRDGTIEWLGEGYEFGSIKQTVRPFRKDL